jgi:hypothetical protein
MKTKGLGEAPEVGTVDLRVPSTSEYLRLIRLVAADAAVRAGLNCEEVEDFRIAIDELSHALMTVTNSEMHLSFRTAPDLVVARGTVRTRGGRAPTLGPIASTVVAGVCDEHGFHTGRSAVSFVAVKRAAEAWVGAL